MKESKKTTLAKATGVRESQRKLLISKLRALNQEDEDAMLQLDEYCSDRRFVMDDRVRELLICEKLLAPDGEPPDIVNEAVYEFRTGQRPFWLD